MHAEALILDISEHSQNCFHEEFTACFLSFHAQLVSHPQDTKKLREVKFLNIEEAKADTKWLASGKKEICAEWKKRFRNFVNEKIFGDLSNAKSRRTVANF